MKLIATNSPTSAQALADRAQVWLISNIERYTAEKWCDVIAHPTVQRWAVVFEDRIAAAFTPEEIAGVIERTEDWNPPKTESAL